LLDGGAAVALLDLDATVERTAAALGGRTIGVQCDVTDADAVEAAVSRVVDELGGLHVLVNNAGVTRDNLLFKLTEDDWDTVIGVHLKGAFLMTRAAQAVMVEQRYGRVVSLSSVSALGNRGQANYATAKMGLQGFTRTLAIELGQFGITANAVAPGFIVSDMTDGMAARMGITPEQLHEGVAQGTPVRRVGQVDDIARAIEFLAAEESSFITGQTLYVDGGARL
jgi:3-oxoacyl-[acyl-carrier protein] reductase